MGQLKKNHVGRVLGVLENNSSEGQKVSLGDVIEFAAASAESFQDAVGHLDSDAYKALSDIGQEIGAMKSEISRLQIHDMKHIRIPEAGHELDAIVESTEEATNTIMAAAEAIMAADSSDHSQFSRLVSDKVMEIFEACSFQDITGQRISKVVQTLEHIDTRVTAFIDKLRLLHTEIEENSSEAEESPKEKRKRELILHGPQLKGEGVSQDDVDKMLRECGDSAQSEIDRLFG